MAPQPTRLVFAACLLGGMLGINPVDAQNVLQANAELQPLFYTDEQGYKGCGLRAIVLTPPSAEMKGVDLSVNLWIRPRPLGMVKASSLTAQPGPPPSVDRKPPTRVSLALESSGKPLAIVKPEKSEDGLYVYGGSDAFETADLMARLFAGERLFVGVHMIDSAPYFVFAFEGSVSQQDAESFHSCMRAVLNALKDS